MWGSTQLTCKQSRPVGARGAYAHLPDKETEARKTAGPNLREMLGAPQGHPSPGPLMSPSGEPRRGQLAGALAGGAGRRPPPPPRVRGEAALSGLCLHTEAN